MIGSRCTTSIWVIPSIMRHGKKLRRPLKSTIGKWSYDLHKLTKEVQDTQPDVLTYLHLIGGNTSAEYARIVRPINPSPISNFD